MKLQVDFIKTLSEEDRTNVDLFIMADNSSGEFINTYRYLSYHENGKFNDFSLVFKDKESGSILMVCMFNRVEDTVISHQGTSFAGLVVKNSLGPEKLQILISFLEQFLKNEGIKKIVLKLKPIVFYEQPKELLSYLLSQHGYEMTISTLINVIDLSTVKQEDIIGHYKAKRRNHVKKSLKSQEFHLSDRFEDFSNGWSSLLNNYSIKHKSLPTHSIEEIKTLKSLFDDRICYQVAVDSTGSYSALALVYKFKNVYHTQYLDVDYKRRSEYPNLYLLHSLITNAKEDGFKYFSFGGSTLEGGSILNTNLYNFKNGFGGGEVVQYNFTKLLVEVHR